LALLAVVEFPTPHHLHAEMAIAACYAGKHVSVQKPMALDIPEANRVILAADKAGVLLRVYENLVFYPPIVQAKQMIKANEIGDPQMIHIHYNSGSLDYSWKVPIRAWLWRFNEKQSGGGPIVFDHGYHLFSIARYLMGDIEKVYAWIDRSTILPGFRADAPATIMFQFKSPRRYGVMDFSHTPKIQIDSLYYADDNRVEVIGDKGILFINRCTARTIDLPELMLFRDGVTTTIDIE
jgi:predicted dehydrogenase